MFRRVRNTDQVPARGQVQPSTVTSDYWLWAFASKPKRTVIDHTYYGKWLLYVPRDKVDEAWAQVAKLVEEGRLGDSAKVSTARANPNAPTDGSVIIVYAKDWRDIADLRRILANLREAGLGTGCISFKRDDETHKGAYAVRGDHNVCIFTAEPGQAGEPIRMYTRWLGNVKTYLTPENEAEVVSLLVDKE